jgi:hypothetical protein
VRVSETCLEFRAVEFELRSDGGEVDYASMF